MRLRWRMAAKAPGDANDAAGFPDAAGAMTPVARLPASIAVACMVLGATAQAQDWPARPVRIVSPFAAGGSSDTMGRLIAERLSEQLHQPFYVENRGGAGGLIGSAAVASAAPDGYTFLISSIGTHVIAPSTSATAGYDPLGDFTHVAFVGGPPIVIAVHPSLGVRSVEELRARLKGASEALPYVSPGPGTVGHLIAEFWAERDNLKLAHVAYKGSGQALTDLVAGHVKMGSITWTAAIGQMRGRTIVPLAVSAARRMTEFPDVPTLKELGYPELAVTTWFGFAGPAGLARATTERMNREIGAALDAKAVRDRLDADGFERASMSPAELTAFVQRELAKWGPLAKKLTAADAGK
jgi:tripartite-type tricarboxylate transporter receptor subunit TctC